MYIKIVPTCVLGASLVSHWIHIRTHQDQLIKIHSRYTQDTLNTQDTRKIHQDTIRYMYVSDRKLRSTPKTIGNSPSPSPAPAAERSQSCPAPRALIRVIEASMYACCEWFMGAPREDLWRGLGWECTRGTWRADSSSRRAV